MTYSTAIFDLDGTLLDTLSDLAHACNVVLDHYGYPQHPATAYNHFVGDGLQVLMERITPSDLTQTEISSCCEYFQGVYAKCWDRNCQPYAGIIEMLKGLQGTGVRCSVLSNKPHEFTVRFVKKYFRQDMFEVVFGKRPAVPKKPDPAGVFEILDIMDVDPGKCIYIGDTATDMQTGKSAGLFTIGVLWGFRDEKELRRNNADLIVKHPQEIVDYVVSAT